MENKLIINKANLLHNINFITKQAKKPIIAVIKDNFYGLGMQECLPIFETHEAISRYAVADLNEYFKINQMTKKQIIVFKRLTKKQLIANLKNEQLEIVVDNLEYLKEHFEQLKGYKLHLKINTGMNRNGIDLEQVEQLITILNGPFNLNWQGIFSHFYHLEDDYQINNAQITVFKKVYQLLMEKTTIKFNCIHMQASSGVLKIVDELFTHVRPGFMLTGLSPFSYPVVQLKQVAYIESIVSQIRKVSYGSVGYGLNQKNYDQCLVAVAPIGYAFGFTRAHSGSLVTINNNSYEIIGKISTDYLFIKVDEKVKLNDKVKLLFNYDYQNHQVVNYEAFTLLNERIKREIIE